MTARAEPSIVICNVRVFDGTGISDSTCVRIDGGEISAIGRDLDAAGARVVDGAGGTLLPGFIDAHVHLHGADNLEQLTRAGITTALDMACWPPVLVAELRNRRGVTDIRSAGIPATAPGSTHSKMPGRPDAALLAGPSEAEDFVRDRLAEGSDYIKVIADVPGPDQATLDAIVAASHRQGKLVVAHAARLVPYQMALAAKVDVITHVPLDAVVDDVSIAGLVQSRGVAVPTLTMMDAVARKFFGRGADGAPDDESTRAGPGYHNAQHSVWLLHRAGVPILAGTDANATVGVPANISHGASLHRELELLVQAGLSPVEAIAAATWLPARHFGLADRGAVRVGLRADLVLIDGDPSAVITDSRRVHRVWCAGIEAATD
jgi:imidazolonepropionase-like amidohydrolase